MSTHAAATKQYDSPTRTPDEDIFGLDASFARWLTDVQTTGEAASPEMEPDEYDPSEIYIGSFPGSNCELSFEGVLHFDGYSIGNISSPDGTLVLTRRGRIEADINVGTAIINGTVTGNIHASERVVLESHAKVTGQIYTTALSVRLGAIWDGDCALALPPPSKVVRHTYLEEDEMLVTV